MKNTVVAAIVALVIGLAAGFGIASLGGGGPKAPEVVASAPNGSLDQMVKDLDGKLATIEEQFKQIKRTPKLEDQTFQFNTTGAAAEGPDSAKLKMVVFSDFQCPFCRRFADSVKVIRTTFPNDVQVVFMNFPLDNGCNSALPRPFHDRACMGAMAATFAQEQGKFWEMHDWLFQNQDSYSPDTIAAQATAMGLDAAGIKDAIATNKYRAQIEAQASQLLQTGSRGTPTVFINGRLASNVRWDDAKTVTDFINSLLNPEPETKKALEPTVKNPGSLPASQVVLPSGVTLEAWIQDISSRLDNIKLPAGPGKPNQPQQPPRRPDPNQVYNFDNSKSPALGPDNAKATLVVFSDFLCPHCFRMAGAISELHKQFPNDLRIVFKNVPGHQGSPDAHEAAMEAYAQGKFWEMHDLIFANREKLTPDSFNQFAQQLGLNQDQFKAAMTSHNHREELKRDLTQADSANVAGTPTIFINGKYQPSTNPALLAQTIQAIISGQPIPPPGAPIPGGQVPGTPVPGAPVPAPGAPAPAPVAPPAGGGH